MKETTDCLEDSPPLSYASYPPCLQEKKRVPTVLRRAVGMWGSQSLEAESTKKPARVQEPLLCAPDQRGRSFRFTGCGVMDTVEAQDMRVTGKYVLNDTYNCARGGSNLFKHIKRNLGQKIQVSKRMQLCTQPFHLGKINSVSPQASLNAHRYMPIPLPHKTSWNCLQQVTVGHIENLNAPQQMF